MEDKELDERIKEIVVAAIDRAHGQKIDPCGLYQRIANTIGRDEISRLGEWATVGGALDKKIDDILKADGDRYTMWQQQNHYWYGPLRH